LPNIPVPVLNFPIVDKGGIPAADFARWITQVTNNDIIIGTGSPEGVVDATVGRQYMDDSGSAGSILYIKKLADIGGDITQGWILV